MKIYKLDRKQYRSATVWDSDENGELKAEFKCKPFSKLDRDTRKWAIERFFREHGLEVSLA